MNSHDRPLRFFVSLMALVGSALVAQPADPEKAEPVSPRVSVVVPDLKFTEGPVWDTTRGGVVFSDIDLQRTYLWREGEGLAVLREGTNKGNGNAFDHEGRLLTCEGEAHRVVRIEKDGAITVLADKFEGVRLNGPNDLVVGADGTIYFTDPNYGYPEGGQRQFVYLIRPDGTLEKALPQSFNKPNGIGLSPDGRTLYLNVGSDHMAFAYPVLEDGRLAPEGRRVADGIDRGLDGMTVHPRSGTLFLAAYWNNRRKPDEQGLNVFSPRGRYLGVIPIPGNTTNACFDPSGDVLYVTSSGKLFRVELGEGYAGQRIGETRLVEAREE